MKLDRTIDEKGGAGKKSCRTEERTKSKKKEYTSMKRIWEEKKRKEK